MRTLKGLRRMGRPVPLLPTNPGRGHRRAYCCRWCCRFGQACRRADARMRRCSSGRAGSGNRCVGRRGLGRDPTLPRARRPSRDRAGRRGIGLDCVGGDRRRADRCCCRRCYRDLVRRPSTRSTGRGSLPDLRRDRRSGRGPRPADPLPEALAAPRLLAGHPRGLSKDHSIDRAGQAEGLAGGLPDSSWAEPGAWLKRHPGGPQSLRPRP